MPEPSPMITHRRLQRVALVRLLRTATTLAELEVMVRTLDHLCSEAGQPLIVVGMPASGLIRPSEEIRAAILAHVRKRFASGDFERVYLIVPTGNLFTRALVRSFFAGLRLLLGLHQKLQIVERIEDVAGELERACGIQAPELIKTARELTGAHGP